MSKVRQKLIFIDDSGDPGFKKVSSDNLVMAAVVFDGPDVVQNLNSKIQEYRKSRHWRDDYEFKFRKVRKDIIAELLNLAREYDFQIYAVHIDKKLLKAMPTPAMQNKLYNWTVKELLKIIPMQNAKVKIDGYAGKKSILHSIAYLRQEINPKHTKQIDIKYADSKKNNLIQLADAVAGAINRHFQPEKAETNRCYNIIKQRVVELKDVDPTK